MSEVVQGTSLMQNIAALGGATSTLVFAMFLVFQAVKTMLAQRAPVITAEAAREKIAYDGDIRVAEILKERLEKVEKRCEDLSELIERERNSATAERTKMRDEYEVRIRSQELRWSTELALMRRELDNAGSSLELLLTVHETQPEKIAETITLVRGMRDRRSVEIAAERGHAAGIVIAKGAGT